MKLSFLIAGLALGVALGIGAQASGLPLDRLCMGACAAAPQLSPVAAKISRTVPMAGGPARLP